MGRLFHVLGALPALSLAAAGEASEGLLDALVMADIGHPREDADDLVTPWPMGKSAEEGAFSLYEGLRDYVESQAARPKAIFVLGDVAYGGGEARVLNSVRDAFQKYMKGVVPPDMVFPSVGNHDVHYFGCTATEFRPYPHPCFYGSNVNHFMRSKEGLSYDQWRANWLAAFPGLTAHTSAPPPTAGAQPWSGLEPSRYTVNIAKESSIYLAVGLATGSHKRDRTEDTPKGALEEEELQCAFLADALAESRAQGKSVFVYLTHDMSQLCTDMTLIQQIDIWIFGHKHDFWQNVPGGSVVTQESRFFPAMVLIGNGGFDEAHIDVVSFGHLREELHEVGGEERVRVRLQIRDTCVSNETCPSSAVGPVAHCWDRCAAMPGGYDGGGGPRKATPSKYRYGFTFDAPRRPAAVAPAPVAPFNGTWKLQVKNSERSGWLAVGPCPSDEPPPAAQTGESESLTSLAGESCLLAVDEEASASNVTFYDGDAASSSSRLAVWGKAPGPVVLDDEGMLVLGKDFWFNGYNRAYRMSPSEGARFEFSTGTLELKDVAWKAITDYFGATSYALQKQVGASMTIVPHLASCDLGSSGMTTLVI